MQHDRIDRIPTTPPPVGPGTEEPPKQETFREFLEGNLAKTHQQVKAQLSQVEEMQRILQEEPRLYDLLEQLTKLGLRTG